MFEWIMDPNAWLALGTLTILEIVLGIDNIIFLSLVVAKLPKAQQNKARRLGLAAAMIMRLALLASIAWVIRLTHPLFTVLDHAVSARDLILLLGGLFLIWKKPAKRSTKPSRARKKSTTPRCTASSARSCRSCCSILSSVWTR